MALFLEEVADRAGTAIEDHLDVGVTRRPGVGEALAAPRREQVIDLLPELVERLAERSSPFLVPVSPGSAAAVGVPALDAVGAAPGALVVDLDLPLRRVKFEELAVVRQPDV